MEQIILGMLRVLCPHLKKMAAKTENPIDDIVVRLICTMVGSDTDED